MQNAENFTLDGNVTDVLSEEPLAMIQEQLPRGFNTLYGLNITMYSISVVLCVILILAMTVPLFNPTRRRTYSSFNLYIAYLSVPDLILSAYAVKFYFCGFVDPGYDVFDDKYLASVTFLTVTGNMYVNAFLAYEIFRLLSDSHARKRCHPPTITKVTKQAIISYGIGIILACFDYWLEIRVSRGIGTSLHFPIAMFLVVIGVYLPLFVVIGITVLIYNRGLLVAAKSMQQGRLKVIAIYYLRIVMVYILVWFPANILGFIAIIGYTNRSDWVVVHPYILAALAGLVVASQVPLSFVCILTKPDARKLIVDLLSNCVRCCSCRTGLDQKSSSVKTDPTTNDATVKTDPSDGTTMKAGIDVDCGCKDSESDTVLEEAETGNAGCNNTHNEPRCSLVMFASEGFHCSEAEDGDGDGVSALDLENPIPDGDTEQSKPPQGEEIAGVESRLSLTMPGSEDFNIMENDEDDNEPNHEDRSKAAAVSIDQCGRMVTLLRGL